MIGFDHESRSCVTGVQTCLMRLNCEGDAALLDLIDNEAGASGRAVPNRIQ